jgi:hypothetical protein
VINQLFERMPNPPQELTDASSGGLRPNGLEAATTQQIRKRETADTLFDLSRIPTLFV